MKPGTLRRTAPLAAAAAVLAVLGGTAYALRGPGTSPAAGGEPPPLRLTSISTTADSATTAGSGGYRDDRISLVGTLPPGPDEAPVRRLRGAGDTDVKRLATALGLDGPVDRADGGSSSRVVRSGGSKLVVAAGAGSPWRYDRDEARMCPEPPVVNANDAVSCAVETDSSGEEPGSRVVNPGSARAAAMDLLRAAGLGGSRVTVTRTDTLVTVSADPVVEGLPTSGLTTVVGVDAEGVVTAQGWLGETSPGATYPLLRARQAYDRLVSTPMPVPLIACAEPAPADQSPDIQQREDPLVCGGPVEVTGARFGLSLQWEGERPLMVPSWLFDVSGASHPLVGVAVAPRYLAPADVGREPEPTDPPADVPPMGVPGSSGSGEPGFPGSPAAVPPEEPDGPPATTRFASVSGGAGPRELKVSFYGGAEGCYSYAVEIEESSRQVRLLLVETVTTMKEGQACPELAQRYERTLRLSAPVGDRQLLDAGTGERLEVSG